MCIRLIAGTIETKGLEAMKPTLYGYDGLGYTIGDRVELHPGTDLWARGARFGVVVGVSLTPDDRVRVRLDKLPRRVFATTEDTLRRVE